MIEYIPTRPEVVEIMLDLAEVGSNDVAFDLGSGDGRVVIAAAKRGAKAIGVEIDENLISESGDNARKEGVEVEFRHQDLFLADLSGATVVLMVAGIYATDRVALKVCELPKGTKVVSAGIKISWMKPKKIGYSHPTNVYLYEL